MHLPPAAPVPPAPGEPEHPSLGLVNSVVQLPKLDVVELLGSPADATKWLVARGLATEDAQLQDYCSGRLIALRGQIRELFEVAVQGRVPAESALAAVNDALTRTPTVQLLAWDPAAGFHLETSHPVTQIVEHALTAIAADAVKLVTGPEAPLLAACGATPCNRYLLRTHARRHWCSKRCGDRVRAARSYARRDERTA